MIFGTGFIVMLVGIVYARIFGAPMVSYKGYTFGGNNHDIVGGLLVLAGIGAMIFSVLKLLWNLLP